MNDDSFLFALLEAPSDNDRRLVYADWLEDQADAVSAAKAEFLRLSVLGAGKKAAARLQQLAADLDTRWLAVVSRLAVENCAGKRVEKGLTYSEVRWEFLCDRRWDDLQPTDDRGIRFCQGCQQNVHYCDTIMEARQHAWDGHCIAVDLGVMRRKDDLVPRQMVMGRATPAQLQAEEEREEERMKPDPVSARRAQQRHGEPQQH